MPRCLRSHRGSGLLRTLPGQFVHRSVSLAKIDDQILPLRKTELLQGDEAKKRENHVWFYSLLSARALCTEQTHNKWLSFLVEVTRAKDV